MHIDIMKSKLEEKAKVLEIEEEQQRITTEQAIFKEQVNLEKQSFLLHLFKNSSNEISVEAS